MNGEEGLGIPRGLTSAWQTILLVAMALTGALLLVALIVTLGEANRQRDRALSLQSHSYDVMILARSLSGTIARSEASLGRYVISTDKQLGQLYFDEWRLAARQIDRLDQLTNDNGSQQPEINALRAAYDERGDELSLTALNTNYGKNSQALGRFYKARKAPSLQRINNALDRIIVRERNLLQDRTARAMESVAQSNRVARILATFGVLIVLSAIVLGWLTVRALTDRAVAKAEAEAERERAEQLSQAVTHATEELRRQEARLRQVQKMEAVGQLTGGIAHDFNNMLAVVLGGLELARRNIERDPTAASRHIESAVDGANRAAALTSRLLAFAREQAINPEPIVAGALVAGMRDMIDRALNDGILIDVVDTGRDWQVRADRVQLENTILNLAVNARDAMDGRGQMTIAIDAVTLAAGEQGGCAAGDYVAIVVTDTGCGMAPEVIERAFEPFFTTKALGKGTGLGLSQIFGFVRQQRGEVAIRSIVGEGTTVTLFLPRDVSGTVAVDAVAPLPLAVPTTPALLVLVVEDDPRVLAATLGALEELGHDAIACDDPLAVPTLLRDHATVDLIITDVLMPNQTGPEMIAALGDEYAHLAVLFVTGFAGEANEKAAFGRYPVLRKPFTLAKLEQAIDAAIADPRPAPPQRFAAE